MLIWLCVSTEATGEECTADKKQDLVSPTEWVRNYSMSPPSPPHSQSVLPWSLINFLPVLPCSSCSRHRKPMLLTPPRSLLPCCSFPGLKKKLHFNPSQWGIWSGLCLRMSTGAECFSCNDRISFHFLMWGCVSSQSVWCPIKVSRSNIFISSYLNISSQL